MVQKIVDTFLRKDGRLNRWRYFKRVFSIGLVFSLLMTLADNFFSDSAGNISSFSSLGGYLIAFLILCTAYAYVVYCLDVRRLHDLGKSNTLALVRFALNVIAIPVVIFESLFQYDTLSNILLVVGVLIGLYLIFKRGTVGANQYGEDPLT